MTKTHTNKAVGEYNAAVLSLDDAEQFLDILGQAQRDLADDGSAPNGYLDDAFHRAGQLVREMRDDLQHIMDTYTPEECGL